MNGILPHIILADHLLFPISEGSTIARFVVTKVLERDEILSILARLIMTDEGSG
jgi:hypothetical protein